MFRRGITFAMTLGFIALAFLVRVNHAEEVAQLRSELYSAESDLRDIKSELEDVIKERDILVSNLNDVMNHSMSEADEWVVDVFRVTGYAPFDNISGMCSDGDPTTTSTGTYPTAGRTIAVDPNVIPYGTPVWIDGHGWRIAEDTGGMIRGNRIDIMVDTYEECFEVTGEVLVVYKK